MNKAGWLLSIIMFFSSKYFDILHKVTRIIVKLDPVAWNLQVSHSFICICIIMIICGGG